MFQPSIFRCDSEMAVSFRECSHQKGISPNHLATSYTGQSTKPRLTGWTTTQLTLLPRNRGLFNSIGGSKGMVQSDKPMFSNWVLGDTPSSARHESLWKNPRPLSNQVRNIDFIGRGWWIGPRARQYIYIYTRIYSCFSGILSKMLGCL